MALPELPDDRRAPPRRYSPADQPASARPEGQYPGARVGPQAPGGSSPGMPPVRPGAASPYGGQQTVRGPQNGVPGRGGPGAPLPSPPRRPAGPPANGRRPVDRPVPPRRHDPADDEPTVVHHDLISADDDSYSEIPGRHRRRAGAAPSTRSGGDDGDPPSSGKLRSGRRRRPTFWKELPLLIVVALVLTFLIQTFLAKVYVIPSGSMETTLHGCTGCNNDRVLVDKITYRFTDPAPGDVVVFRGPDSWSSEISVQEPTNAVTRALQGLGSLIGLAPPDEKDFVKRVIAVGGQTVSCCDSRGRVMVDGEPLDEPYIYYLPAAGPPKQTYFGPITVPEGELWMMGDSRNNSADSRVPDHGPVPVANVIGKARVIVLPLSRFGWIASIDPQSTAVGMPAPGVPAGAPLGLGLVGTLPLALWRRRLHRPDAELWGFLPGRSRV
ncbi:signal peptidase I [Pseudonocardia xinjiangensis]|uniref:signal peptidase I n=1 Tax=Pseudonocardia xinjiangensis TaxID=75289 RepID=UPI003D9465B2